jgi:diguanylate cyclase (GGDEF)-like protein/PAS domain S-box-containing protein
MQRSKLDPYPLSTMFELYPIGTYRSSHDGQMLRANAALLKLNGYDSEEELLSTFNDLARQWYVDPNRRDEFMKGIERDGHVLDFVSEIYRHKTGERLWVKENAHVLRDANGKILFYEGTVEDITERRRVEEEVQQLAFYDHLTRLPNRRLFHDRLSQTLTRAKREQSRMALLFIDLDKFKSINDQYGHEVGDWLLESVARRIESCLRASDTAARVGGDEFLALLPDMQTIEDALGVAEKIRIELDRPFVTPSQLLL